jgi:hypothetical protein
MSEDERNTELGTYNGRRDRHDSIASGSYDALPSTSGRLSSLGITRPSQSDGSIADVSLTVHHPRHRHRPPVSDVMLPACSLGT